MNDAWFGLPVIAFVANIPREFGLLKVLHSCSVFEYFDPDLRALFPQLYQHEKNRSF